MTIRELIYKDFGVDLSIIGCDNSSIDNPIIIEHQSMINDYIAVEYAFLKYIGIGRGIEWKMLGQELLSHKGKIIDKIKIETIETTEKEIIPQIENCFFDITECYD